MTANANSRGDLPRRRACPVVNDSGKSLGGPDPARRQQPQVGEPRHGVGRVAADRGHADLHDGLGIDRGTRTRRGRGVDERGAPVGVGHDVPGREAAEVRRHAVDANLRAERDVRQRLRCSTPSAVTVTTLCDAPSWTIASGVTVTLIDLPNSEGPAKAGASSLFIVHAAQQHQQDARLRGSKNAA